MIPLGVSAIFLAMKRLFIVPTVVIALSSLLAGCSSNSSVDVQNAEKFASTVSQAGVVVLDLRTPGEYAEGHISGAINIDVEDPSFDQKVGQLDKSATYAVYCRSGRRSALATEQMAQAGFTSLAELDGGLLSWNGPLVTQ